MVFKTAVGEKLYTNIKLYSMLHTASPTFTKFFNNKFFDPFEIDYSSEINNYGDSGDFL